MPLESLMKSPDNKAGNQLRLSISSLRLTGTASAENLIVLGMLHHAVCPRTCGSRSFAKNLLVPLGEHRADELALDHPVQRQRCQFGIRDGSPSEFHT